MSKSKKDKNGICAFCGAEGEVTEDHVPPKNLFKGFPDSELIKVPGCNSCNEGNSKDDEYFRAWLVPQEDIASHPQAQKLNKIVREKFDATERKGLESRMYSQLHSTDVYTPVGIYLGERKFIYGEYSRIDAILKKILKGLFFHLMKTPFPSTRYKIAVVDIRKTDELQGLLRVDLKYWLNELNKMPIQNICNVFSFECAVSSDLPRISVWLLTFFGNREFFGITYPNAIGPEIKLLDAELTECNVVYL